MIGSRTASLILVLVSCVLGFTPCRADDEPSAEDYLNFLKPYFAGVWERDAAKMDGQVLERGVWTAKSAPHGRCAVTEMTGSDGKPVCTSIDGYDPKAKCWRAWAFFADGSVATSDARIAKKTLATGKHAGATFEAQRIHVASDGTETRTLWKTTIVDRNTFETIQLNGPEADRVRVRFTRK